MRIRHGISLALITVIAVSSLAQENGGGEDGDIFSEEEFEQQVEESTEREAERPSPLNFGGAFEFANTIRIEPEPGEYLAEGRFSGRFFVEVRAPEHAAAYLSYRYSHPIYQATNDASYELQGENLSEVELTPAEFFLDFDIAKSVFFRAGNQLISWGATRIWRPTDFLNLQRRRATETLDLRRGVPGLRVHVPISTTSIFLFADFSETVVPAPGGFLEIGEFAESTSLALRLAAHFRGVEVGLTGYAGRQLQDEYGRYGLDATGNLLGVDLFGELALSAGSDTLESSVAAALGFEQTLGELDRWSISGEGFYQSDGYADESDYPAPTRDDYVPLYLGTWYAYASVGRSELFLDEMDATLSGYLNASDLSYRIALRTDFDFAVTVPFAAEVTYSGGGEGKEFTPLEDRTLELYLGSSFSF